MKQQLFSVGIKHRKTGERLKLQVWAADVDAATWGLRGVIGPDTEYVWTGSGPVYNDHGDVITREMPV